MQEEAERVVEGRALCILDGSVLEKPESVVLEGLSPAVSSKARRLSRPRLKLGKGYFRGKPSGLIVVPGFHWLGVLVSGWAPQAEQRPVTVGAWRWYAKPWREPNDESVLQEAVPSQSTSRDNASKRRCGNYWSGSWGPGTRIVCCT